ncbi:MAG TPA: exo-alpha-sialidase [Chloroflexota bacterium]|nr:exo-alpha-sialidase [Chloroflexota bacterium]
MNLSDGTVLLLVGTKRGLFAFTSSDRQKWQQASGPMLGGSPVYNGILDQRSSPRMYAAENQGFFGSFVKYSDDFGETWKEPSEGIKFPEDSGRKLENVWIVQPGRENEPDIVYAGVDPASLWTSHDRGETWELNAGLESHPSRDKWQPGFGGMCLHSIVPDRTNPNRMWVGISAVGCLRSEDGGKSWEFANKGTRADFNPPEARYPEFGQCIHRLVQHSTNSDTLYQQNHCGVYRSHNGGDDWIDIRNGLPGDFGFPIVMDPHNPETIYVIVEAGSMEDAEHQRYARENYPGQFTVYRSQNAGDSWESLTKGLPSGPNVHIGVLRHGMCSDGMEEVGVYVGTNTGQLFASADRGDSWNMIADFLPPIYSVNAAVVGSG